MPFRNMFDNSNSINLSSEYVFNKEIGKYESRSLPSNKNDLLALTSNYIDSLEILVESLREDNKRLKEETYAQEELAAAIAERDEMREDCYRGFPISKDEKEAIHKFMEEHEKAHPGGHGVSGGKYTYEFCPTGLGTVGTVKCHCGEKFIFRDI